ncbi:MAG: hypothetical protein ABIZ91_01795 [Gemmatimonadaceae bacterium]
MRRWTVMLIPHDTERPRSIALSERALHVAASLLVALMLVAMVGVALIIVKLGEIRSVTRAQVAEEARLAALLPGKPAVDSLRRQVEALSGTLDTIRRAEAQLRAVAGTTTLDTATLLRRWFPRISPFRRVARPAAGSEPFPLGTDDPSALRHAVSLSRADAASLLVHASSVAERFGVLADSAARLEQKKNERPPPRDGTGAKPR